LKSRPLSSISLLKIYLEKFEETMEKNLTTKLIVIIAFVIAAVIILYPPQEKLKPGIDLAGGTSLIYEIDTQGLEEAKVSNLSENMINVLRRRIDPANIQNLIWRPQGDTRFEIQMPLADAQTRQKRQAYEKALDELLAKNINPAMIIRSLKKPAEQRADDFEKFAQKSEERNKILSDLAEAYDQRQQLRQQIDELNSELKTLEGKLSFIGVDLEALKTNRHNWLGLDEKQLEKTLTEFLASNKHLDLLTEYINNYRKWAEASNKLTNPVEGVNIRFQTQRRRLDNLNLSQDQIETVLAMDEKSVKRVQQIEQFKTDFPDRADLIDRLVAAFDAYRPYRGRLDDPKDLQRMLKGAGILEFRLLPTLGHPEINTDRINNYVEILKTKGPKYASDNDYVWCELENVDGWRVLEEEGRSFITVRDEQKNPVIISNFGNKFYVLASNNLEEIMIHTGGKKQWALTEALPGNEPQTGSRAVDFVLDDKGGIKFGNITGRNIGRPLCILLDGKAVSAPKINSRITTRGQITGNYTETEQRDLVNKLNAGSLPARLIEKPISVKTIGPSIGADNRDKGIRAGLIGLGLVVLCMLGYYTLAGAIADAALLMNLIFILATMALVRATFTLPGIAGIILTIGMSVDANVLIFERIREEQQSGCSLRVAIRNGYQRAFRTIFDANLTTFITALILYWVASEEIKGFAIVLMLGIVSSMFTALFVTRLIFELFLSKRVIKDHIMMRQIIKNPQINWMGARAFFLTLSILLVAAGLYIFFTRDDAKDNKYDIEFTGGTSVEIQLKEDVNLSRQDVEDRIRKIGADMKNPAIASANVYSIGKSAQRYEITTTETNKTTTTITLPAGQNSTIENLTQSIKKAQKKQGGELSNLIITATNSPDVFTVQTSQLNKSIVTEIISAALPQATFTEPRVDEVVNDAILTAFSGELKIRQNLGPEITSEQKITDDMVEAAPELAEFVGGVKLTITDKLPATIEQIEARLADLKFRPDTQQLNRYPYKILTTELGPIEPNTPVKSFVYASADPEAAFRELEQDEWKRFVDNEKTKVISAASFEASLPRVTQIDPSIGAEAKTRALIAIILSLFAIVAYIWVRFGNVRYGMAAIAALVHDVCITLGAVTVCTYIAFTAVGEKLLIGDFKIDLAMIAAFLTLIGYSLNDTIVVFDRIRENRRKGVLNANIITNSINQTLSRTLLTSFTTFIVVLVMYIFGGTGLRGFTFAIGFGVIIGTYSSIAIAAPLLLLYSTGQKTGKNK
jgi:SecD/SecF fusion protein